MQNSNGASHPQLPSTSQPNPYHAPVSQDAALVAYQAYQQTMRQFLSLQEQVMRQFLSAGQMGQIVPPIPPAAPAPSIPAAPPPIPAAPLPIASNGRHNGNGAAKLPQQVPVSQEVQVAVPAPVVKTRIIAPVQETVEPAISEAPVTLDRQGLLQILLQLVSDRTGYPTEMLGLDQDLEAELGIDSIKRVEILGALQKTLPSPLAASVQEQMESLTRVKTLNRMVEQLLSLGTGGQGEELAGWKVGKLESSKQPSNIQTFQPLNPGQPSTQSPLDRTTLTQTLLHLVSDRTGYPTEMLGLEQDLEAELGIDSIKRVEILGALQKNLPSPLAASMQSNMESLTRVKTLNVLVEQLLGLANGDRAQPITSSQSPIQEEKSLGKLPTGAKAFRAI